MSSRIVTRESAPQLTNGGGPAAHLEDEFKAFAEESLEWAQAAWPLAEEIWPDVDPHLEDPNRPGYCRTCGCVWPCPAYGPAWVRPSR